MPAKLITRKREYQPSTEQEQAAPVAKGPSPEADEDEPVETGRPYQAFVEREARKYWENMVQPGSLAKPEQQELRAAAMPILCTGLRKRSGVRFLPPTVKAHMVVNAMHLHAKHRKELTRPYTGPYPVSDHIEALIQYAEDTGLLGREIPLPEHEGPKHPPIYYYIDPITRQPTPREDALLRAEYVRDKWHGYPPTRASHIHPSVGRHGQPPAEVLEKKSDIYYSLYVVGKEIKVKLHRVFWNEDKPRIVEDPLSDYNFTPHYVSPRDIYCRLFLGFTPRPPVGVPESAESEARRYWQDMVKIGSLAKPDQQELRAAAMPILIQGLRRRSGAGILPPTIIAHLAVDIMHQRAAERGETTRPYTGPYPSLDYIEALIQYAEDTRLVPR